MTKGIHFLFGQANGVNDYLPLIDRFSKVGFNCIELPPEPFLDQQEELKELLEYAKAMQIEIIFSCGFDKQYDMASENSAVRQAGIEHLKQIFDIMGKNEISLIGGTAYTG